MTTIQIGDYRLIATLGRGSMTDVFLAVHQDHPNQLAVVKRVRADAASSDEAKSVAPSDDEAQLALRLRHPNIVRTFAVGNDATAFRATEYLEGQPLDRLLAAAVREQSLPVALSLRIVADVLSALEYAYELKDAQGKPCGVLHGDVHPRNIFITYQGVAKLLDFGAPRLSSSEQRRGFVAPEHAQGEYIDAPADVYAVGAVLKACLGAAASSELAKGSGTLRLHKVLPELEAKLDAICKRALDSNPAQRYPSAKAMRTDLAPLLFDAKAQREELSRLVLCLFDEEQQTRKRRIAELLPRVEPAVSAAPAVIVPPPPSNSEPPADPMALSLPHESRPSTIPPAPSRRTRIAALALAACALGVTLAWSGWFARPTNAGSESAAPVVPKPIKAPPAPAAETVLRLCGSNTIGAELAPAYVEALLTSKGASEITRRAGTDTISATIGDKRIAVTISARGSSTAFSGLAAGSCDVGMASRAINEAEVKFLGERGAGDLRSAGTEHVIGLDGIAVVVHPNNALRALDRAALHGVFTGKINDWSALGGNAGPIHVLARDGKSGTFDTFKHLILGSDALVDSAKRFEHSDELADAVASDTAAIGFVGLPYVRAARALAIGDVGAAPTLPSQFTVATEEYLLSRRLYLYTLAQPPNAWTPEFVSFALSDPGQELVAKHQFVDLAVRTSVARCDARCPTRYAKTIANAERASIDFRFRTGSDEPDSKAGRDIERIVNYLSEREASQVLLLGFADKVGKPQLNAKLSMERSSAIDRELALRGVHAAVVTGFGADMPVASNESDAGRQRNRRVEVWITQ